MRADSAWRRLGLAGALLCAMLPALRAQALPKWTFAVPAKERLKRLWAESIATQGEQVGCLGGTIGPDTVHIARVLLLDAAPGDSLTAPAEFSLITCGPPEWIGTVHTHIRSTDDPSPARRFSLDDRNVMSLWFRRWRGVGGAFCVLYSDRDAHCEVYPPGRPSASDTGHTD